MILLGFCCQDNNVRLLGKVMLRARFQGSSLNEYMLIIFARCYAVSTRTSENFRKS